MSAEGAGDLFAMGAVLWEMLVGRKLFVGDSGRILNQLLNDIFPRASSLRSNVPPELDDIVSKALEKDPDARYQTAEEMAEALEAYVRASGVIVRDAMIGAAVTSMFQDGRHRVQQQIRKHMANPVDDGLRLPTLTGSLPRLEVSPPSTSLEITTSDRRGGEPSLTPSWQTPVPEAPSSVSAPGPSSPQMLEQAPPSPARRRGALVGVGAAGLLLLAVALLVTRRSNPPISSAAPALSTVQASDRTEEAPIDRGVTRIPESPAPVPAPAAASASAPPHPNLEGRRPAVAASPRAAAPRPAAATSAAPSASMPAGKGEYDYTPRTSRGSRRSRSRRAITGRSRPRGSTPSAPTAGSRPWASRCPSRSSPDGWGGEAHEPGSCPWPQARSAFVRLHRGNAAAFPPSTVITHPVVASAVAR